MVSIDELIEEFDTYASHLASRSPHRVAVVIAKLTTIVYHTLPKMKRTVLQLETQSFYESLLWNARRVLREPDAVSSIKANQRGMARLRAPRSVRTEAELRQRV
jgi:hypothetical protein